MDTTATGAAGADGISLSDLISGKATVADAGTAAASSALDTLNGQLPDLSYSAGQSAAQGALAALTPYLPYLVIGLGVLVLIAKR